MPNLMAKPSEMTTYSSATSTTKKKSKTGQKASYTTPTESDRQTDTFINQSNTTYLAMSSVSINLSGLASAINDVINIFIQYLPLFVTIGIMLGIVNYVLGGFNGLFSGVTGLFGGA